MANDMPSKLTTTASAFAFTLLAAASSPGGPLAPGPFPDEAAPAPAAAQALPPGHPPAGTGEAVPPVPPGAGTGAAGLTWAAPAGWKAEAPSSSMRRAQYRVPGPAGDAECVVFYFGPGQGGDASSNAARWASQFRGPDGREAAAALKTAEIQVRGFAVTTVDVEGTYAGGMGGASSSGKAGYRLVGAIVAGPDANWFFKLTGPGPTVAAQKAAFEGMIRSLAKGS